MRLIIESIKWSCHDFLTLKAEDMENDSKVKHAVYTVPGPL